jgi:hypothetical protein
MSGMTRKPILFIDMKPDPDYKRRGKTEFPPEIWKFINEYDHLGEYGVCAVDFENAYDEITKLRAAYHASLERDDFLTQENARLCNLLENMTQSRDTMIEDRNLLDNEVARLRELLNRAIEIAESSTDAHSCTCSCCMKDKDALNKLKAEARLAPAPEEPANPTCSNTAHKFSHCDCKEPTIKESLQVEPEWRELGPDEVIQEGDEWYGSHYGIIKWHPVTSERILTCIGNKCSNHSGIFRTRRPLPVQKEMPLEKAHDDLHAWMKLQEEINREVAGELQAIRDEVQKLKEAK